MKYDSNSAYQLECEIECRNKEAQLWYHGDMYAQYAKENNAKQLETLVKRNPRSNAVIKSKKKNSTSNKKVHI